MINLKLPLVAMCFSLFVSCNTLPETNLAKPQGNVATLLGHDSIIAHFAFYYDQLPEKQIAIAMDSSLYAQYASPTERYKHGALGDYIEAGELVVYHKGSFVAYVLPNEYVYEDIRPRLFDVDGDSIPEIITIRSKIGAGAGIVIYKFVENTLKEYAYVAEIGTSNRWLNIAAIQNMDGDSLVELLWIQTPHIGGILKATKIREGKLEAMDQKTQYSNHAYQSHNLCLSVVTDEQRGRVLYLPTQQRSQIAAFSFSQGHLNLLEKFEFKVDFDIPLHDQYDFCHRITSNVNCILP